MKLVSMINFVYSLDDNSHTVLGDAFKYCLVREYANFLNQPLNLGMFVPAIEVEGKWEVLEEPICYGVGDEQYYGSRMDEYQQAKDRVLFEGFEYKKTKDEYQFCFVESEKLNIVWDYNTVIFPDRSCKTINDLIKYAPTLTAKGQELSGLNK